MEEVQVIRGIYVPKKRSTNVTDLGVLDALRGILHSGANVKMSLKGGEKLKCFLNFRILCLITKDGSHEITKEL